MSGAKAPYFTVKQVLEVKAGKVKNIMQTEADKQLFIEGNRADGVNNASEKEVGDNSTGPEDGQIIVADYNIQGSKEKFSKQRLIFLKTNSLLSNPSEETTVIGRRLLIDNGGEEKRLTKLMETFFEVCNSEIGKLEVEKAYNAFTDLVDTASQVRLAFLRTCLAIEVSDKANKYWDELNCEMKRNLEELRILIKSQKGKIAEHDLKKRQCIEKEAMLRTFGDSRERHELEKQIEDLQITLAELTMRQEEQEALIGHKKVYLTSICDLIKRLASDDEDVAVEALVEVEERGLSDVSIELD